MITNFRYNLNLYINFLAIIFAFGEGLVKFLAPISGILMILLWLIEGNFKTKFYTIIKYKSLLLFIFFIFYLFLTLFISANINYHLTPRNFWVSWTENPFVYYFRHYFFYTLLLIVLVTSIQKKFIKYILSAFIFGMLINEITSYLIFFKFLKPLNNRNEIVPFFINHSYYSFFLVITVFLMIIEIIKTNINKYIKSIYLIFISTASINLMLNTGRVGQISFFIMLFVSFFYFFKFNKKTFIFLLIIPILFIGFYSFSKPFHSRMNQTKTSIESIFNKDNLHSSLGLRVAQDIVGIEIFKEYPLLGVGIDEAMNAKAKLIDTKLHQYKFVRNFIQFHNQYIQYLVEGGIIAILLLFIFIIFVFLEKTTDIGKDIKYIIFPIFLLTFLTETPLLRDRSFALFILFYSIILIYSNKKSTT